MAMVNVQEHLNINASAIQDSKDWIVRKKFAFLNVVWMKYAILGINFVYIISSGNAKCICKAGFGSYSGKGCADKLCPDDCSNRGTCVNGLC